MADTVDLGSLPPPGHERHQHSDSPDWMETQEEIEQPLEEQPQTGLERSVYL